MLNLLMDAYSDAYKLSGGAAVQQSVTEEYYNTFFIVRDNDGKKLFGNDKNLAVDMDITEGVNYQTIETPNVSSDHNLDNEQQEINIRYIAKVMPDGNQLIVGQNLTALHIDHPSGYWMAFLILGAMALAGVVSILLGFFILRRLESINNASKLIMETGDLTKRIPSGGSGKDFDALADNLNSMLSQIQQLMADVRQVSDNIAHDLRTPLTRLRNNLDYLDQDDLTSEERANTLTALKNESDNLLNIFSALLRITNIESGQRHNAFEVVKIETLLAELIEFYEPLAEQKQQQLVLNVFPCEFLADGDLLFQSLANIVDNAIKYTPVQGRIDVSIEVEQKTLSIIISDNGIGVDSAEFSKLFRRFYRVDKSRNLKGNGLGLSLVSAVVELHKGKIDLYQNAPGLKVVISLPISQIIN